MRVFYFDEYGVAPLTDAAVDPLKTTSTPPPPPPTSKTTSTTSSRSGGLATKYQTESAAAAAVVRGAAAAAAAAAAARHHFSPLHSVDFNPHHYNNAAALVNMLTPSSNQYLRPEYLSPLPTTLDAKKSPLALLAQTCSNIGADTPSSKSLIPSVDKRSSQESSFGGGGKDSSSSSSVDKTTTSSSSSSRDREKSTPHQNDDKSSFKPYESIKKEVVETGNSDTEKSGFRTPTSTKSSSPCASRAGSVHSEKGSRSSPANGGETTNNHNTTSSSSATCKTSSSSSMSSSNSMSMSMPTDTSTTIVTSSSLANNSPASSGLVSASMHSQHNRISIGCGNMFVEVNHHESGLPKDALSAHLSSLGYKPGQLLPGLPPSTGSLLSSLSNCTGCTQVVGGNVPLDTAAFAHHHHQGGAPGGGGNPLKSGGYPVGSALSPYVAYARVKTATGGTTLVPICRDPYCTNCQLSMQSAQQLAVSCPSGCSQCNHEKAVSLGVHHHQHPGGPPNGLSGLLPPGMGGISSSSAPNVIPLGAGLYTSSMLTPRPYVCNWIAGDTYCGKRFTTSEELLQHLRTHTNLSAAESAAAAAAALNPLLNPSLSMPSAANPLGAGCHLHYSMAPSLTSPAGLHRTYPTSLSPVSSLSAAAAAGRYHPYKPQLGAMPGGPPLSPFPPHPGFSAAAAAQYFSSPYAMYGQRLGAAVHP